MSTDLGFMIENFDPAPDAALAGVLFAEDFDLPAPAPPLDPPALSSADLAAARQAAFVEGRHAAEAEAAARSAQAEALALTALAAALNHARQAAAQAATAAADLAAHTLLQTLATALPELCAHHGPGEAQALAATVLPMLAQQPHLTIRTNPHNLAALRAVAARQANAGRITLIPTDALAEGDVAIEWEDGALVRDGAALRTDLARLLAPLGVTMPDAAREMIDA